MYCITMENYESIRKTFLSDLRYALKHGKAAGESTEKAVYGVMTGVPDSMAVKEILGGVMGGLYDLPEKWNEVWNQSS